MSDEPKRKPQSPVKGFAQDKPTREDIGDIKQAESKVGKKAEQDQ